MIVRLDLSTIANQDVLRRLAGAHFPLHGPEAQETISNKGQGCAHDCSLHLHSPCGCLPDQVPATRSSEMPESVRRWPAWRRCMVPKIVGAICEGCEDIGSLGAQQPSQPAQQHVQGRQPQQRPAPAAQLASQPPRQPLRTKQAHEAAPTSQPRVAGKEQAEAGGPLPPLMQLRVCKRRTSQQFDDSCRMTCGTKKCAHRVTQELPCILI